MEICFINQSSSTARIPRAVISRLFSRTQNLFNKKISGKSVSVIFVSPKKVKELNLLYRKINRPTNVLSFSCDKDSELGDIIICPSVAKEEAKISGMSFNYWVGYLAIHGMLHLLGYDHFSKKSEEKMDALTKKILCE
jgi:probable rRNA maturation factor